MLVKSGNQLRSHKIHNLNETLDGELNLLFFQSYKNSHAVLTIGPNYFFFKPSDKI